MPQSSRPPATVRAAACAVSAGSAGSSVPSSAIRKAAVSTRARPHTRPPAGLNGSIGDPSRASE